MEDRFRDGALTDLFALHPDRLSGSDFEAAPPTPLIGALLRVPFETVRDRMLAGLHERGFSDLVAAHLDVFQYPGPENQRPLQLATQTRMTKQATQLPAGASSSSSDTSPANPTTRISVPNASA